jgi:hypothetical protein
VSDRTPTARVKIVDFRFRPRRIEVSRGTRVSWRNRGDVAHTTTSRTDLWDSGSLAPGDTFSRVFRLLDPVKFHGCFLVFMRRFSETIQGVIAIDGKTLRRSFDRASEKSALHLVSAKARKRVFS